MAILNFQKPDKIILQKATDFEAQFEFRPLEPGYGVTIGNALRRVLLSSLEGFAIVGIRIEGIDHEFDPGRRHCRPGRQGVFGRSGKSRFKQAGWQELQPPMVYNFSL